MRGGSAKWRTSTARARSAAVNSAPPRFSWRAKTKFAADGRTEKPSAARPSLSVSRLRDHHRAARLEIGFVLDRRDRARLRQTVDRIRIETVLHPPHALDQSRVAERVADPQAGEPARLRHRLHDQQIRMRLDQRNRRFGAEIDIGLVDHHRLVGMIGEQSRDLGARQRNAGRRVGVGRG